MSAGKTFQVYIPGDTIDAFQARAEKVAAGNISGYVQRLHADESKAKGAEDTKRAIVALAELYHPTLAHELELQLNHGRGDKPVNQGRAIARILEALHEALKREFDPEAPFTIYSGEEEFTKLASRQPEILRMLKLVVNQAEHVSGLNEDAGELPGEKSSSPVSEVIRREQIRRAERAASLDARSIVHGKAPGRTRTKK